MAISFASFRAKQRFPFKVHNLFVDGGVAAGGTPKYPLVGLNPTEAPTNTAEGGVYYDDDLHALYVYNGGANVAVGGQVPKIVGTAAATLTAADSGSVILFSNATGYTVTLPAAQAGLNFRASFPITVTSGNARLACASGDFFRGTLMQGTDTTYLPAPRTANGSSHLAFEGNGGSTGGFIGDWFDIVAVDDTIWQVTGGLIAGSGTEASPWKTS